MYRFALATIAVFWLTMMGLLVERDIVPPILAAREAAKGLPYGEIIGPQAQQETVQMTIHLGGKPIGQSWTQIRPRPDHSCEIVSNAHLTLTLGGASVETALHSTTLLDAGQRLVSFTADLMGPSRLYVARAGGKVVNSELHLAFEFAGHKETAVIPFDPRFALSDSMSAGLRMPNLYVGKTWNVRTLDLQSLLFGKPAIQTGTARVVRQEDLDWHADKVLCYVVEVKWGASRSTVWVNEGGDVLRQMAPGGLEFVRDRARSEEEDHDRNRRRDQTVRPEDGR